MLNYIKWFTTNWNKSESFRLDYDELLNSSNLTSKNLEDFNNLNYKLTKLDIFKYITVLDYLFKMNESSLLYNLNPYLVNKFNTNNKLFPYNEILEVNQYKNIIIDLYFLDTPFLVYNSLPLDVLLNEVDKTQTVSDLKEIKNLSKKVMVLITSVKNLCQFSLCYILKPFIKI